MHLQLQTQPPQTLSLRPKSNIHMPQLVTLTAHLNEAIKITTSTFDVPPNPSFLKAQLRLLSDLISDSITLLKGHPPEGDDSIDTSWTVQSCASEHLEPDPGPGLACHFTLCESLIILTIRVLEPAHAPVALGTKLGLAIGAVRRVEHDEAGMVFDYVHHASDPADSPPHTAAPGPRARRRAARHAAPRSRRHDEDAGEDHNGGVYPRGRARKGPRRDGGPEVDESAGEAE